jgi:glycosyltransferase involved in cell wall biosynthesis
LPNRVNFTPLLSREMPYYPELRLNLPPVMEIMEWADRQQFDAVHVSTPGPMGLCGWLVAKQLRVPLLGTYHTDFPAYLEHYTHDHRAGQAARMYMTWLCGEMAGVFTRSRGYVHALRGMGVSQAKLHTILPSVDTEKFHRGRRDDGVWDRLGVRHQHKVLYSGRVSVEKNLPLLATAYKQLCARRQDVALVVAGEGPYLAEMRKELAGLPTHFLGVQDDASLAALYASSDLLAFPSRTDTLGQVVMEAQASGLPAIVSNEGGPKEIVEDGVSGLVIPATQPAAWAAAMDELLSNDQRRRSMADAAPRQVAELSPAKTFEAFWRVHAEAVEPSVARRRPHGAAVTV